MKVTLLHPVRHDGKAFEAGAVVDLPKDAAQALVACGSAEEGGKGRAAKADADAKAEADAKADADADAGSAAGDEPEGEAQA
jgi:hypothetical protein